MTGRWHWTPSDGGPGWWAGVLWVDAWLSIAECAVAIVTLGLVALDLRLPWLSWASGMAERGEP